MLFLFSDYIYQGYNTTLSEELSDSQKKLVDSWGKGKAEEISSEVFPKGQDRISIPLEQKGNKEEEEIKPHPDVEKHLRDNGFEIADYKGGYAKDKHGRTVSIGKALNKTNAPLPVKQAFENDPVRKGSTQAKKGLKVIISRHPHDVAGMSTDQGWTSCMTMKNPETGEGGGCNQHYLQQDVKHGTHVAYLVHDDDNELKRPIARIALKPFTSDDGKHTVLRPESRAYGTGDSSFARTVNNWVEKNFPAKPKILYRKNQNLYHDSGVRAFGGDKDAFLASNDPKVRASAFTKVGLGIDHEDISRGLNDEDDKVRTAAIKHREATADHISTALMDQSKKVRAAALANPNATEDHLMQGLKSKDINVKKAVLKNRNASEKVLSAAVEDPKLATLEQGYKQEGVFDHPNTTEKVIQKGLDSKNKETRAAAIKSGYLSDKQINDLMDDNEYIEKRFSVVDGNKIVHPAAAAIEAARLVRAGLNHSIFKNNGDKEYLNDELTEKALNHPDHTVRLAMLRSLDDRHPKYNERVSKLLDDKDDRVVEEAAKAIAHGRSKMLNKEMADKLLNHPSPDVQQYVQFINRSNTFKNLGYDPDKITDEGLKNSSPKVREAAARSDNLTKEHVDKIVNDKDNNVIKALQWADRYRGDEYYTDTFKQSGINILKKPLLTKEHLTKLAGHSDPEIVSEALKHKNSGSEAIDAALNNQNPDVVEDTYRRIKYGILHHKKLNSNHIDKILSRSDTDIDTLQTLGRNDKLNQDHIDRLMNSSDISVRRLAAAHSKLSSQQIYAAQRDKDPDVRYYALTNKNVKPEHINAAIRDNPNDENLKKIKNYIGSDEDKQAQADDFTTSGYHKGINSSRAKWVRTKLMGKRDYEW
jgi:hypothetical protein